MAGFDKEAWEQLQKDMAPSNKGGQYTLDDKVVTYDWGTFTEEKFWACLILGYLVEGNIKPETNYTLVNWKKKRGEI